MIYIDIEIQSPDYANIKSLKDLQDSSTEEFNTIKDKIGLTGAFPLGMEPYSKCITSKDSKIVKECF